MQAIKSAIYDDDIIALQELLNKEILTSKELSIIFIYSVVCHKTEIVKLLINSGVNYNFMDNYAFRVACCNGYYDICQILLSKKYQTKMDYEYAFTVACSNGHLEIAKLLVKYGVDIKTYNNQAFIWAYCNGHKNIIDYLLEYGFDISLVEKINMGQYRYVTKFENDKNNIYNIIQVYSNNILVETKK
ncbi:ankyrin repeat protein [Acanthamoeba polyphaga moumouvirus]|uniref:Ankyrin repeat protein n=2 Tax=Moumouvirus TaxID=3080801 RepID=L7RC50_9VIRU|nr:ankyrin repeat protein [Acanthamoeba polyphaga moumouvirus]AEX63027.1 putative ankyrin repeat protein [Moumouvirus Monve]AGC01786.1 ankyrin repeat protein [Acanthamoeba polyphaga moumouvirus]